MFSILNLNIDEKISNFNSNHNWKLSSNRINKYKIKFPFKIIISCLNW